MSNIHGDVSETVKIISIGTYIPDKRINNYFVAEGFGYDKNFIEQKIGFTQLAQKGENETLIDMCLQACNDLTDNTHIDIANIQLITVVTQNPHLNIPHASAILHNALGVGKNCMTFDISQGCAGYCHALAIVQSLMTSLNLSNSLIFTCDSYGDIIDKNDQNTAMLFGDAATVSLLSTKRPGYVIHDSNFGTRPESYDCLLCDTHFTMDGRRVFNYACGEVPESITALLHRNKVSIKDIDVFLLHQASKVLINYMKKLLCIEEAKVEFCAHDYGNTVSSSIPIQLANYFNGNHKKNIVASGFGVGFTWGNCLLRFE